VQRPGVWRFALTRLARDESRRGQGRLTPWPRPSSASRGKEGGGARGAPPRAAGSPPSDGGARCAAPRPVRRRGAPPGLPRPASSAVPARALGRPVSPARSARPPEPWSGVPSRRRGVLARANVWSPRPAPGRSPGRPPLGRRDPSVGGARRPHGPTSRRRCRGPPDGRSAPRRAGLRRVRDRARLDRGRLRNELASTRASKRVRSGIRNELASTRVSKRVRSGIRNGLRPKSTSERVRAGIRNGLSSTAPSGRVRSGIRNGTRSMSIREGVRSGGQNGLPFTSTLVRIRSAGEVLIRTEQRAPHLGPPWEGDEPTAPAGAPFALPGRRRQRPRFRPLHLSLAPRGTRRARSPPARPPIKLPIRSYPPSLPGRAMRGARRLRARCSPAVRARLRARIHLLMSRPLGMVSPPQRSLLQFAPGLARASAAPSGRRL